MVIKVQGVDFHFVDAAPDQLKLDGLIKLEEIKDLLPQTLLLWQGPRDRGHSPAFLDEAV